MNKWLKVTIIVSILLIAILGIYKGVISKNKTLPTEKVEIIINVIDNDGEEIFSRKIATNEKYLSNVLKGIDDLNIVTDKTQYGEYITEVMELKQDDKYYWAYYIDENYATVGISSCEVKDNCKYTIKLEKIEY